jgi:hypothetical protein
MGYYTTWNGTIKVPIKDWPKVKAFMKLIMKLCGNCRWISSHGPKKGDEYWFHPEDEWIGYNYGFKLDEENHSITINTDGKFYKESVETLCYCILILSPETTGDLTWDGEEDADEGYVSLCAGTVNINSKVWKPDFKRHVFFESENPKYITPKYDFVRVLKFFEKRPVEEFDKWAREQTILNTI